MVATHGAAYARARLHADLQHADEAVASSQGRVTRNWKIFWCLRENVIGVGGVLFEEASLRRPADFVRLRLHIARYSQVTSYGRLPARDVACRLGSSIYKIAPSMLPQRKLPVY